MLDLFGTLYDIVKDMKEYYEWNEEEKLVDLAWPEKSGLKTKAEADGLQVAWCRPDLLPSRQLDGYEVIYEMDKLKRIRRRLVLRDGLVLVGKRGTA